MLKVPTAKMGRNTLYSNGTVLFKMVCAEGINSAGDKYRDNYHVSRRPPWSNKLFIVKI